MADFDDEKFGFEYIYHDDTVSMLLVLLGAGERGVTMYCLLLLGAGEREVTMYCSNHFGSRATLF